MKILKKKVSPSDCTLAIALPLTRDEFFSDLQADVPKDYAKFSRAHFGRNLNEEVLWKMYHDKFSSLVEGVATEVEDLGVKVVRGLRLSELPSLMSDRQVVTILSHWRGAQIEFEDLVNFQSFVRKLKTSFDPVVEHIRRKLSAQVNARIWKEHFTESDLMAIQKELIAELNVLLETENLGKRPGFGESLNEQPAHMGQRLYLNRIILDKVFPDELKAGNRMEFFDGLQSAEAIGEQIPHSFDGLLDLIVCHSVLSADVMKSIKRNFLIISNENPADPGFRLFLYKAIIRVLHKKPDSFVNTMMIIRQELGNYLI